jgi:hypothetical protein
MFVKKPLALHCSIFGAHLCILQMMVTQLSEKHICGTLPPPGKEGKILMEQCTSADRNS